MFRLLRWVRPAMAALVCTATAPAQTPGTTSLDEIVVLGQRPLSMSSSQEIRARDYETRPRSTTHEILNNVPGLVVAQHQGGAKAMQWLVRGFDADHGTDFAVFVDGLPVNLGTHGHGQGYADTNFVIPETIAGLELYKGPYFAQFGDFANAGALNLQLKDSFAENFVRAEGGYWGTQRYVAGFSPQLAGVQSLLAVEAHVTDGPFRDAQNLARYNVLGKVRFDPLPGHDVSLWMSIYAADWDASGQIPVPEVAAGRLDRFGSVDPTEGGKTDRQNLNARYTIRTDPNQRFDAHVYASRYKMRLYSNFTFFKETGLRFYRDADGRLTDLCAGLDPAACAAAGRDPGRRWVAGDGIDQDDERMLYGGRASYTRLARVYEVPVEAEVAVETRHDDVDVALYRQAQRQRFLAVNRNAAAPRSLSGYVRGQALPLSWLRFELGMRWDTFFFHVSDRLPQDQGDAHFEEERLRGNRTDGIVSPKASIVVTPARDTDLYANFGTGFHSNDARASIRARGERVDPLVRSLGYEVGSRTRILDRVDLGVALWLLDLDSELVFSGDAGTVEPSDSTRRWGLDFESRVQFLEWLFFDYDVAYSDPKFRASGDPVALAYTLLMNGGFTAEFENGFAAAIRLRYLDDRPANEDRTLDAQGYTLVDVIGRYRWRNFEAHLNLLNVLDRDWREAQFADQSCVRAQLGAAPGCFAAGNLGGDVDLVREAVHFTPGNPFWIRGGLTVYF